MDYWTMYPWAPENLLEETSIYTTSEQIMLYMKSERPKKCILGRENSKGLKLVPCKEDKPICCDESLDPDGPFCYFYTTIFKKVLLRLPLYNFEKELFTKTNVAPAQSHPNSWAFVWGFSILCTHFGLLPFVEAFLYFFEAKRDLTLLDGFPLYWTQKPNFQDAWCLESMPQREQEVCLIFSSLKVVFDTTTLISKEFSPRGIKAYIGICSSFTLTHADLLVCLLNFSYFSCRQYVG